MADLPLTKEQSDLLIDNQSELIQYIDIKHGSLLTHLISKRVIDINEKDLIQNAMTFTGGPQAGVTLLLTLMMKKSQKQFEDFCDSIAKDQKFIVSLYLTVGNKGSSKDAEIEKRLNDLKSPPSEEPVGHMAKEKEKASKCKILSDKKGEEKVDHKKEKSKQNITEQAVQKRKQRETASGKEEKKDLNKERDLQQNHPWLLNFLFIVMAAVLMNIVWSYVTTAMKNWFN